jgi:3-methyladenine DNA glycosylase AlkD
VDGPQGSEFVSAVRAALEAEADPARAAGQQAYMKSEMPFLGITSARRRAVVRPVLRDPAHRFASRAEWEVGVRALWDGATRREERYAALDLLRLPTYRVWHDAEVLPLARDLIVSGAWWDLVDETAHVVGEALLAEPTAVAPVMRDWAVDPDRWLRRVAVISQLWHRDRADTALLEATILPNLDDRDFFVRKAIGWALRQHARTDPDWVRAFVAAHADRLSGLSCREALKHL